MFGVILNPIALGRQARFAYSLNQHQESAPRDEKFWHLSPFTGE
jgi:hypothetical protein